MQLKRLLAFCALLFAAALFAAPTVQNALLPNAEIVLAGDKAFSKSPFVKELSKTILAQLETMCEGNDTLLQAIKEVQQNPDVASDVVFSAAFSGAFKGNGEDVDTSKIEFIYGVEAERSLRADIQKRLDAELAKEDGDMLVKQAAYKEGWLAYELAPKKEPEFKILFVVSPDGKQLFTGTVATVKRQLDNPPALAPYVAQYYNNDRTKGGAVSFAILLSEPLQKLIQTNLNVDSEEDPSAAMGISILKALRVFEYSFVAKADSADMRLDGSFSAPEMAGMLKPMIDQFLPQVTQMVPIMLGKDLPFAKTLKSYNKGSHTGISATFVKEDVDAFIEFCKEQIASRQHMLDEADSAFDDEDEE